MLGDGARRPTVLGRWDTDKVAQVVKKLLANALKFGAGAPIEVTVEELEGTARLVVVDHGIGIEPEELPHIFGRFERAVRPGLTGDSESASISCSTSSRR